MQSSYIGGIDAECSIDVDVHFALFQSSSRQKEKKRMSCDVLKEQKEYLQLLSNVSYDLSVSIILG